MSPGNDSLPAAVHSAKEQDLKPLVEECVEALELDGRQVAEMEAYLQDAWFFGVRTGQTVMVETKMGQTDAGPVIAGMQGEFQEMMERLGEALNTTVRGTIRAWHYLGQAWIAGAKFWEVEVAARLIEQKTGGIDDVLRELED